MRFLITLPIVNMRMRVAGPTKWDSFTVSAHVLLIWVVNPPHCPPTLFFVSHFLAYLQNHHPPLWPLLPPLMPRETPTIAWHWALSETHSTIPQSTSYKHILRVLFLSSHWSVTEATWQVTHTLDVIGSRLEIQPLEWWETVTLIVYLCCRRGEWGHGTDKVRTSSCLCDISFKGEEERKEDRNSSGLKVNLSSFWQCKLKKLWYKYSNYTHKYMDPCYNNKRKQGPTEAWKWKALQSFGEMCWSWLTNWCVFVIGIVNWFHRRR